jgi:hypothetical protein
MTICISRIAALVAVLVTATCVIVQGGMPVQGWVIFGIVHLLALSLIWFPEKVNDLTLNQCFGGSRRYVDMESPPGCLIALGWLILAGFLLLAFRSGGSG